MSMMFYTFLMLHVTFYLYNVVLDQSGGNVRIVTKQTFANMAWNKCLYWIDR